MLLEQNRATIMQATPASWRMLLETGGRGGAGFKALRGGETVPPELAEALLRRVGLLWNMYGPSETTVWSTCSRVELGQGGVTIGRPIDNTTVWILDDAGAPVPIGVPGELYIGGAGVALGYHTRPELTNERFVPDRFSSELGARLYHTGDLARWRANGQLQHFGRTDSRSTCAATASSWARSRSRWPATPRSPRRSWSRSRARRRAAAGRLPRREVPSRADVGRAARAPARLVAGLHGAGGVRGRRAAAAHPEQQG